MRWKLSHVHIWAVSWQNQQNDCAPSEDSDQPGHLPSLILGSNGPKLSSCGQRRLGRCPGWSESSLGAHVFLFVLSWGGSIISSPSIVIVRKLQNNKRNSQETSTSINEVDCKIIQENILFFFYQNNHFDFSTYKWDSSMYGRRNRRISTILNRPWELRVYDTKRQNDFMWHKMFLLWTIEMKGALVFYEKFSNLYRHS